MLAPRAPAPMSVGAPSSEMGVEVGLVMLSFWGRPRALRWLQMSTANSPVCVATASNP